MVQEESDRRYLTADELRCISEREFGIERVNQVRDMFLFSCYTGLAYADIKKLSKEDLDYRADGRVWVITKRQKTKNESRVPLLPLALALLQKYSDHPECSGTATVLPVLSNQKMNGYLKEIGNLSGVEKALTTHVARHTFATTVTSNKGVPLESVSKRLGHKNIKETQRYAKILDEKIEADMKKLFDQFLVSVGKRGVVRKLYPRESEL
jgi:integrase